MKSLSIRSKFILAFMAASLVAIALVGIFTSMVSNRQFQSFIENKLVEELSIRVIQYYEEYQTLLGIQKVINTATGSFPQNYESFNRPGIILIMPNRIVLLGDENHHPGTSLSPAEFKDAHPIEYNGDTIAYLAIITPQFRPNPQEKEFIERTNSALLYASLIAVALAILLGLIFTSTLLKPLSNLNTAIGKMEKGELLQEVPKTSDDELGDVIEGFNQMSHALAAANARREQMTADIAHELRSPLTVINGYLEALEDGVLQPTSERIKIIQQEVGQLNRLVSDLRTLALADSGQLEIIKDKVEIQTIFNHLRNAYELIAKSKKLDLSFNKEDQSTYIYADEGRILQVLSNLIINAIRHTSEGGIISINAFNKESGTVIEVNDTGEGIPKEDLDLVFERFYRADPSRQTTSSQSGLGLSIVKALVEAHGGKVDVKSEIGKGSTFSVFLPNP
jgi:signal transduction histidine kinase